jgi:hypothetical protein
VGIEKSIADVIERQEFVSVPGVKKIGGLKRTRSSTVEEWNPRALR